MVWHRGWSLLLRLQERHQAKTVYHSQRTHRQLRGKHYRGLPGQYMVRNHQGTQQTGFQERNNHQVLCRKRTAEQRVQRRFRMHHTGRKNHPDGRFGRTQLVPGRPSKTAPMAGKGSYLGFHLEQQDGDSGHEVGQLYHHGQLVNLVP